MKNFPPGGQTSWATLPSQPVNLPDAWPLIKPPSVHVILKMCDFHNGVIWLLEPESQLGQCELLHVFEPYCGLNISIIKKEKN